MKEHFYYFKYVQFRRSFISGLVLLIVSLFINFYAGIYATERASNSVTDIILSNIRVYDLDGLFVYGSWVLVAFIVLVCFSRPQKSLFVIKSIALFVLIRAVFITLTHIGPFPTQVIINPRSFLNYFVFGGDLFFSGHTGLPFLLSLIFWQEKVLRYIFLAASFMFAVVVLLSHLHYTIDVLSAFFISYGIFHIALKVFKKDKEFFDRDILS
ncbi:MAG: conserved rane protein of unknown function [Parcubacteria group bacterium]|nr:conserved rane protein of unknown function [Parcubacteria group bacterium]